MILNNVTKLMLGDREVVARYQGDRRVWTAETSTVYGFHIDPSISDPAQAVTYLADAVGKTPAGMTSYRQTVKGYRDLEYIQSTGTQILITDFIPMLSNRYEADIKFTLSESQAQKIYMGMIQFKNGSEYTRFIVNWPKNNPNIAVGRYIFSAGDFSALPNTTVKTSRNTLILDNTTGSYGSTRLGNISVTLPTDATLPIALFGYITGEEVSNITNVSYNDSEMTLYGFRVYDSTSQLIHNLIPVERIFDGELGLVDTITGTFYANAGTGTFVKGAYITTTEYFDYGDWKNAFFMPKPCMLRSDGTVAYYLNPNDYTKKADGTASDVSNASFDGNAMMEWPLIWYKFEAGNVDGEGYFYCSNKKVDDSYKCWCNINSQNEITEHFYTAIYNVTGTEKARSLSGIALTSANGNGGTTGEQEETRAKANNTTSAVEWYLETFADRVLIFALLILMSKCLDDQSAFGRGLDTGGQSAKWTYITGTLDDKGLFWGDISSGTSAVKVFGMENFYGCVWQRTAGLVGTSNGYAYKLTYGTADGSNAESYNSTGTGYLPAVVTQPSTGYVSKMLFGEHGMLPSVVSGSSSTFYACYFYTGSGYALFGGNSNGGLIVGSVCVRLVRGFGYSDWDFAGSLSCKPLKKEET